MKHIKTLSIIVALAAQTAFAAPKLASKYPVDIPPDATSTIYHAELLHLNSLGFNNLFNSSSYVQQAIVLGKRNLDWLKFMNEGRPEGSKITISKPGQLPRYPIDKPNHYSPATIERDYKEIASKIPAVMKAVLYDSKDFTKEPGLPIAEYEKWAKAVDKLYQISARWNLLSPDIGWYSRNRANDVRGYYYLSKEENLESKLTNWSKLAPEEQQRLSGYLTNLCYNTVPNDATCAANLKRAIARGQVAAFYNQYNPNSKQVWDDHFVLEGVRSDFEWTHNNDNLTTVPFRATTSKVEDYLKTNIEDEWRWNNWQLRLNFTDDAAIHVEFVPGATPHVGGLNGDTITMDDNAPLTEWDVQWTIRHEFGHVVGFPDCYIEFYDTQAQEMVNYQLDITDLMCSRAGKLQAHHYEEMRKKYLK